MNIEIPNVQKGPAMTKGKGWWTEPWIAKGRKNDPLQGNPQPKGYKPSSKGKAPYVGPPKPVEPIQNERKVFLH